MGYQAFNKEPSPSILLLRRITPNNQRQRREHGRPNDLVLVLSSVEAMTKPDPPSDIKVSASAGHKMPPAVSFQKDTPRKTNVPPPSPQSAAIFVVDVPECESSQEYGKSITDHDPHESESLSVPLILTLLFLLLSLCDDILLLHRSLCLPLRFQSRADVDFHDVHGAEKNNRSQEGVHVLVECWVLEVVVVSSDEDGKGNQE